MKTVNKFADVMSGHSYAELLEIVGKLRSEYQPEAVIAAEEELKKRTPPVEIIEPKEKKNKNKEQTAIDRANEPLDVYSKIYALLLPRPVRLLFDYELIDQGYERQYKEWRQWTFIGVLFYVIVFVMIILIAVLV